MRFLNLKKKFIVLMVSVLLPYADQSAAWADLGCFNLNAFKKNLTKLRRFNSRKDSVSFSGKKFRSRNVIEEVEGDGLSFFSIKLFGSSPTREIKQKGCDDISFLTLDDEEYDRRFPLHIEIEDSNEKMLEISYESHFAEYYDLPAWLRLFSGPMFEGEIQVKKISDFELRVTQTMRMDIPEAWEDSQPDSEYRVVSVFKFWANSEPVPPITPMSPKLQKLYEAAKSGKRDTGKF